MSARGGKYFRPGKFLRPGEDDDDDDDDEDDSSDEDEEEEEDEGAGASKPNGNANANLSSEDEDGDSSDEEENHAASRKRKKNDHASRGSNPKKKSKASSFFDEEAEDDDDDDDEEPYGTHHDPDDVVRKHYSADDIRREQMDDEARELMRQQDRRRAQAGYLFGREDYGAEQSSVEKLAQDIENRHRQQQRVVDRNYERRPAPRAAPPPGDDFEDEGVDNVAVARAPRRRHMGGGDGDGGPESFSAVSQQSLVPSVSDPSLWMISCSTGKEQELVFQLMNKSIALARQNRPLGICGAIAAQSKGRIYIESFSEPAVVEAIQGVRGLLPYTMRLIPIKDMTTVMTVVPKKKPVKNNEWVRMTRGHYKGDLALVKEVRDSGLKCIVQCVPRLDMTLSDLPPEEARVRRRTVKPPQKFFNSQDVAALGKHTMRQRYPPLDLFCDYFEGNYYHEGYLLKEMTVGSMIKPCTEEDPPTLDELQRFRRRQKNQDGAADEEENEGSKMAASLLDELSELQGKTGLAKSSGIGGGLQIGDTVEVIEGDLVGLRGKLVSMDENTVKVRPNDAALDIGGTGEIEFLTNQIRKHIDVGNHVKVTDGRYANETGVVVAVEKLEGDTDFTAVVLTDVTNKEISVRTSQLRESAEIASGQDKLAGYELYDLVVLSGGGSTNEVGVIVRVGREDFTVINNHGISREIRPEELRGKRNSTSNRAVALDVQGNQIRCGDLVNIAEGPHKGKTATIKRMSRAQLFLYSQTRSEHAGIFVVRSRSCVLAGSRAQNRGSSGDGGMSPFSTPQSQSRGGPAGGRGKRDDALVGKTVRIQAGQWKGYLGAVCDATATHVQVELHSRLKKVMVVRERVAVVGDKFGATEDPSNQNGAMANPIGAPTTPFIGGATPMHGGATPMHGGATPMHDSGGDEVWRPGALDQESDQSTSNGGTDEWGADSGDQGGFGSTNDADNVWNSSTDQGGDVWAPATEKQEPEDELNGGNAFASNTKREPVDGTEAPGGGDDGAAWFMERVCVQIRNDGRAAVITDINQDNSATIKLEDGTTQSIRVDEISREQPKEKDMVLVIGGADVGVEGELVCIDGTDAILKDSNEDFKIVDFVHLAKISGGN